MFELKNFDKWNIDNESQFGSGASEKLWLVNPETSESGIFKFPKIKTDGSITGEYWAEKLASELAKILDIPCANVDIGTYNGRIGSMSYNFATDDKEFVEAVAFIQLKYPFYIRDMLEDPIMKRKYSVQMIKNSIDDTDFKTDFLKMVVFDSLIGNSDRHHSNFGFLIDWQDEDESIPFAPIYDNGSSLCAYIDKNEVDNILKDKMKYESLINTKSKSAIGWERERPIRHFDLIEKMKDNYYYETIEIVTKIKDKINTEVIDKILNEFENTIIDDKIKILLKEFILERKNRILKIYNLKGDA